ncbi:peptigoglycan-binding protein LysM [Tateyamaria sp. SN6-1]|uniref:LysM peptidoglycan-binding domain-containing protein n=1 Tax=Tateyamaria sp. SN6-1 TaxID=3092148 RepID=UPI0039F51EF7
MSKLVALMGSNGGLVAGAAVVAVAAVGAGVYVNSLNAPEPAPESVQQAAVLPEAAPVDPAPDAVPDSTEAAPEPEPAAPETAEVEAAPTAPSIDEVRVEADGLTVIAGRAAAGSTVIILLDGVENTQTVADARGGFAAVTMIAPNPEPQVLTVIERVDGTDLASLDEVIIAPIAVPEVQVAEAPASEPETVDTPQPAAETVDVAEASPAPEPVQETADTAEAPAAPEAPNAEADAPQVAEATPEAADTDSPVVAEAPAATDEADTQVVANAPDTPEETDAPGQTETPAPQATAEVETEAPKDVQVAAPTILKNTEEGVEVLSSAPPEVLENIEIDTISYSLEGEVELAGRAQSEADVVRVYVDNRPIADIEVDDSGRWRGALPQIDTGVYTLRVDELNEAGNVTSRVETPFKREDPEALAEVDNADQPVKRITVQTGNTLWGISRERYGDGRLFVQVFEANRSAIRNPDLIFPGQVFELPE